MEEKQNQEKTDFMKETIKQRPLNRKKLVRRTLITAAMAVIFGTVACLTFLVLEPLFSNRLYPEEELLPVEFAEETEEKEILPEDMIVDDSQIEPVPTEAPFALEDEQIAQVLSEMELGVNDYMSLYLSLNKVAEQVKSSLVTVVGVTSDVGWLDNEYENEGVVSGAIVADNGRELLILTSYKTIENADSIQVILADDTEYAATIKKKDPNTGLAILSVSKMAIKNSTLNEIGIVNLGTSAVSTLCGSPIIALGRPMGTADSICFGTVASTGISLPLPDSEYKLINTSIFGSKNASGVVINLRGQVVGLIDMNHNSDDMGNLISMIGITELKKVIERLSNDKEVAYLGVFGTDVTKEANVNMGVPMGAYITEINMDSPALNGGIQSGDVITKYNQTEIKSYRELVKNLFYSNPEDSITLTLMRQDPEGYSEMEVTVVLDHWGEKE